jgi:hypothetical protein
VGIHIKEIRQNEGSAMKTTDTTKYVHNRYVGHIIIQVNIASQ